ncbi:ABC transporter permease subunit [Clostridium sp. MCC353]|uniref:ABC transporter permease n=1 Tax=Clostridium sp. MCC353 TaxID=2592646 RepID=UPI00207AB644|nr:ABC transporter permease subunit [Clostridium sp. MCC353]
MKKTRNKNQGGRQLFNLGNYAAAMKRDFIKNRYVYIMLIPVIAYFVAFHYIPMFGTQIAFKDFSIAKGISESPWVGLKHFKAYFNSYYFGRLIKNTILLSAYNILFGFPAPILLAILINEVQNTRFKRVVQTVTYLPHFISIVIVCALLRNFFAMDGVINQVLGTRINFFMREDMFRPLYVGSGIWQEVGWGSIVYLSAIVGIDHQLYEAAEIDGAGRFQKILYITLPCIASTITVMFIMRVGKMMTLGADKVLLMYNESTYATSDIISTFVYRKGLLEQSYSYSAAVDLVNSVINCGLLVAANKLCKKISGSGLW